MSNTLGPRNPLTVEPTANDRQCYDASRAASVLGLREFDFFRLAYRRWFGAQPDPGELERVFAAYMMRQRVPPWVRQMSREVLRARRAGPLPPDAFGASRYRDRMVRHPRGPIYVSAFIVLWIATFAFLIDTGYDPETSAPTTSCAALEAHPVVGLWVRLATGGLDAACPSPTDG